MNTLFTSHLNGIFILSCNPAIINNLIDDFGWSIQSCDVKDPDHPDWVHVTAKAGLALYE